MIPPILRKTRTLSDDKIYQQYNRHYSKVHEYRVYLQSIVHMERVIFKLAQKVKVLVKYYFSHGCQIYPALLLKEVSDSCMLPSEDTQE